MYTNGIPLYGKADSETDYKKVEIWVAPYAQHVGDYMVEKQAHSEDETPFRTVKITHIASGKSKKLMYMIGHFALFLIKMVTC